MFCDDMSEGDGVAVRLGNVDAADVSADTDVAGDGTAEV